MAYIVKLIIASAAALVVTGLAIAYVPLETIAHLGDIVLFTYLGVVTVALPGGAWWATMRLMRML